MKRFPYVCLVLLLASTALAQTSRSLEQRVTTLEKENKELRETVGREVERMQFGDLFPALGDSHFGMGPAASKVYGKEDSGVTLAGYGEFLYQDIKDKTNVYDALRSILYVGYRFDERFVFNSEIEIEHGSTSASSGSTKSGGSVSLEFGYLDYLDSQEFNVRVGLLLVPMGFINEMHEPTTFLPASRSETEQRIIPSTWRENGVGVFGDVEQCSYKVYAITSLNGEKFGASGLRGGRQKGNRAAADDFGFVARLDWKAIEGLTVGGSIFHGDTGQNGIDASSNAIPDLATTIWEVHAEYQTGSYYLRGLFACAMVDDADTFNTNTGANLGERLEGAYIEAGYDILPDICDDAEVKGALIPFARLEVIDTQADMPTGFVADRMQIDRVFTYGVHYRPIDQIVIKVDFQSFDKGNDRFQILAGYVF